MLRQYSILARLPYRYVSKMSMDTDDTLDLLLLIQQKLRIVQYRYGIVYPQYL